MITNKEILCQKNIDINKGFFPEEIRLEDVLFFDIETTGLGPGNSRVFLIGVIEKNREDPYPVLIQFLAEENTENEEMALLRSFSALAQKKKHLAHFNGTTFDVPYLAHRCRYLGLDQSFSSLSQIDLYRELSKLSPFFSQMPDHKQKSYENLMHYPRKDQLSGKEMINFYQIYVKSNEINIQNLLLLHNHDDLKGMLSLLPLGYLKDFFSGYFSVLEVQEIQESTLEGCQIRHLLFSLEFPFSIPVRLSAATNLCRISIENSRGKIKMPLYEGTLKYFYPDYQNYYFLPYEDEAIHKSVAIYTDPSRRRKAKASECYKKYTGTFVSAPGNLPLPLLKEHYKDSSTYALWPFKDSSPKFLRKYLLEILKWCRPL